MFYGRWKREKVTILAAFLWRRLNNPPYAIERKTSEVLSIGIFLNLILDQKQKFSQKNIR